MKHALAVFSFILLFFFLAHSANASSSYVLPYPGVMPGNKLYKIEQVVDAIKGYLYFGDFGKLKYNLSESDKYLVEAKTLFEYNQFPLALYALEKSNFYFEKVMPYLNSAKKHGKDITEKKQIYESAKQKHIEVLGKLLLTTPEIFIWQDEKKSPIKLNIANEIRKAIRIRENL